MQISRHWRLNAQRYRLEGFRNSNGELSLQARPTQVNEGINYGENGKNHPKNTTEGLLPTRESE